MANQIIPLTSSPQQTFQIPLSVDGVTIRLQFTLRYIETCQYWLMDLADPAGNPILSSIPLITGDWPAANILAQYGYLGIGSCYVINATQAAIDYPNAETLGSSFVMVWGDTA